MLHYRPLSRVGQAVLAAVWTGCLAGALSCGRTEPLPFPRCELPEIACGEECFNLLEDPLHCGGCDRQCAAAESCVAGVCKMACPPGQSACSGRCVDLASDAANCGRCAQRCLASQICSGGTCKCPQGQTLCGSQCVDVNTDPAHCSGCGRACATGQVCVAGKCLATCPAGWTRCGNVCANLQNDREHCGQCGQLCNSYPCNFCLRGYCSQTGGTFACDGSTCTDTGNDPKNCGSCGRACGATQACDYDPALGYVGNCLDRCLAGHTSCGGSCVDIRTDARHCGGCGIACPPCTVCSAGMCTGAAGVLRCGRSCDSLQLWPGRDACSPCSTTCDASGLACQRCAY